MLIKLILLSF